MQRPRAVTGTAAGRDRQSMPSTPPKGRRGAEVAEPAQAGLRQPGRPRVEDRALKAPTGRTQPRGACKRQSPGPLSRTRTRPKGLSRNRTRAGVLSRALAGGLRQNRARVGCPEPGPGWGLSRGPEPRPDAGRGPEPGGPGLSRNRAGGRSRDRAGGLSRALAGGRGRARVGCPGPGPGRRSGAGGRAGVSGRGGGGPGCSRRRETPGRPGRPPPPHARCGPGRPPARAPRVAPAARVPGP